jgi:hypothetical protein
MNVDPVVVEVTTESKSIPIDAWPTKELFIRTLVKDIPLNRAILDLIDNSVDSARELRRNEKYHGLWIHIEMSGSQFKIRDNCKGIPVKEAVRYAFRFGAAKGKHQVPHSVGQFGVGMKRALFKMGRHFIVESATGHSRFIVEEDVDDWTSRKRDRDWSFSLKKESHLPNISDSQTGTAITVSELLEDVQREFETALFVNALCREIAVVHQFSLTKGLEIKVNDTRVTGEPASLKFSKLVRPGYIGFSENGAKQKVKVEMYAGVSDFDARSAGWYVYCNKRLVLKADQTKTTCWGEGSGKKRIIPQYHPQFAYFRGYLYLDCKNASRLPWNTTKTGLDEDSRVYKDVRQEMIPLMRGVINWLNDLKEEKDRKPNQEETLELERAINEASEAELAIVRKELRPKKSGKIWSAPFVGPEPKDVRELTKMITISYKKPEEEVDQVKEVLKVKKNREVGERTFEFYHKRMCKS